MIGLKGDAIPERDRKRDTACYLYCVLKPPHAKNTCQLTIV